MKKFIFALLIGLCFSLNAFAQTLTAKANRTNVPQGETFLLTLDYDGANTSETPDFSVLDKDFTIYSISNSFQSRYVNGNVSQLRQWQVALMPKTSGTIAIPPISLGNLKSNSLTIQVSDAATTSPEAQQAGSNQPRFAIRGTADNKNPYIQQQINYTITLYDTGGLQGEAPQFLDNGQNDWIIRSLREPEVNAKVINGRSVREIKFFYALFPQKSGLLKTPEVRFNGYYLTNSRIGPDPFEDMFGGNLLGAGIGLSDMFATRNPVSLAVKPLEIQVRPAPQENHGNWWLPATRVTLYSEWEPKHPSFKVGEAVNRTVYLKAVGVVENQLPEIKFNKVNGVKQYPEKAITQNGIENNEIVAVKKVSNVYIPNSAGKKTLPAIEVKWFNVKTNQMETAVLPEVNINVAPADFASAAPENSALQNETLSQRGQTIEEIGQDLAEAAEQSVPNIPNNLKLYVYVSAAFIIGLIVSYFLFHSKKSEEHELISNYKKRVLAAAKNKDFRVLRDSLIAWAADRYKDDNIKNIKDVLKYTRNKDFERQLEILTSLLYSDNQSEWNEKAFVEIFEKVNKQKVNLKSASASPLPDLYK